VWLTDRNVVEFHGENGDLLKTISLSREDVECGRAANPILHFILDWIINRLDFRVSERTRENGDEDQYDEDQYGQHE
jgi:hypothetical protein